MGYVCVVRMFGLRKCLLKLSGRFAKALCTRGGVVNSMAKEETVATERALVALLEEKYDDEAQYLTLLNHLDSNSQEFDRTFPSGLSSELAARISRPDWFAQGCHYFTQNSVFWLWERILSLRNLKQLINTIAELVHNPASEVWTIKPNARANIDALNSLESLLGIALPIEYRTWLLQGYDGVVVNDARLYSTAQIYARLCDGEHLRLARGEFPLTWREMLGIVEPGAAVRPGSQYWESGYPDGAHFRLGQAGLCGLLPIGEHDYGRFYMVLRGELRGVIWGEGADEDSYEIDVTNRWDKFPNARAIPVAAPHAFAQMLLGNAGVGVSWLRY